MDAQFAIVGRDFAISVTDTGVSRSIVKMKHNQDKSWQLTPYTIMTVTGEPGDIEMFSEYIQSNIKLYSVRNAQDLTPKEIANFIRGELAEALRSRNAFSVNLLVTGFDKVTGEASLYRIDYLASMAKVPFGSHATPSFILYSVLDREYTPDITLEQGLEIVKKCIAALKTRFVVDMPEFTVKVVDAQGTRSIDIVQV
ncbi:Proteasome subunit beta type-4 [Coemansia spiralis]|uniref:Proteasome subunit beta n=2 Tax=Coemansia TaxID=4863 RepID=A0A9W8GB48_9FUNG|nr:Proteasome subunit beta type-4 [Coemansia umbellata]KAJ2625123.1 Proteasome subunit beta type-4 [Coemansia sp. RSA 1358]KAJ2679924.1 Proteasome subunit beta type-4 [Coemansia spiralis]